MSTPASIAAAQGVGRVAIIGAGSVGSTCAYALLLRRVVSEILLVDIDSNLLNAQVQDLNDAAFLSNTKIRASTFPEAGQCDLIVVTAGAKQHGGESRRDLIERNYGILGNVIQNMSPIRGDAVLLLVSNPVDVLTDYAQKISGLPRTQVFGSGTFLDSVRLRSALAEQTQVAYTAVHAYVLGEHGDSQMVAWSSATIGCSPLKTLLPSTSPSLTELASSAKTKAYSIIAAKGATAYGIASIVVSICETVLFDQLQIRPVSHWVESLGCCLSLPAVLGRKGVLKTIDVPLNEEEREELKQSAAEIRKGVDAANQKG